jgi:hypothetical protein
MGKHVDNPYTRVSPAQSESSRKSISMLGSRQLPPFLQSGTDDTMRSASRAALISKFRVCLRPFGV